MWSEWYRATRDRPAGGVAPTEAVTAAVRPMLERIRPGARVAVLVGSRGIAHLPDLVGTVVALLKERGAQPFLVPAMGSHGGGTPEGQIRMIRELGVDPERLGVSVDASMAVRQVGALQDGTPVYTAESALAADAVVPLNRVKPHSDFRARVESGLTKMLTIGLGKTRGADALHAKGFDQFDAVLPEAWGVVSRAIPVPFGVAVVEDAWHEWVHVEAVPGEAILERDAALLQVAWEHFGTLPFPRLDVLVLREMGKNMSGAGMDPNVTGRWPNTDLGGRTRVGRLVVLDLTDVSEGNATGVGLADIVTERLRRKIDWHKTYLNAVTSKSLVACKLPLVAATDQEAVQVALDSAAEWDPAHPRMVAMLNTMTVNDLAMTPELVPAATAAGYRVEATPRPMTFSATGELKEVAGLPFFPA